MKSMVLQFLLLSCLKVDFIQVSGAGSVEYILYNSTISWLDAYSECASAGGSLLEIRNQIDFNVLQNVTRTELWESTMSGMFWFGLFRRLTNPYKWSTCDEIGNITFWDQEDDPLLTDSACVSVDPKSLLWTPLPCTHHLPFVCQRDAGSCVYRKEGNANCTLETASRINHDLKDESTCQQKCDVALTPEREPCWAYYILEHAQSCVTVHSSDPFVCDKDIKGNNSVNGYFAIRRCYNLTANTTDVSSSDPILDICSDQDGPAKLLGGLLGVVGDILGLGGQEQPAEAPSAVSTSTLRVTTLVPDQTQGDVEQTTVDLSGTPSMSVVTVQSAISVDDFASEQVSQEMGVSEVLNAHEGLGDAIQLQSSFTEIDLSNFAGEKTINTIDSMKNIIGNTPGLKNIAIQAISSSLNVALNSRYSNLKDSFPMSVPQLGGTGSISAGKYLGSPDLLVRDVSALLSIPTPSFIPTSLNIRLPIDVPAILPESERTPPPLCCCVSQNVSERSTSHQKVIQALKVNKSTLSSARRKLVSVQDHRPSSQTIGYLGLVFVTLTFSCLVLVDLLSFLKNNKRKTCF